MLEKKLKILMRYNKTLHSHTWPQLEMSRWEWNRRMLAE